MLTIYHIDDLGQWTGAAREIGELEGWEASWTLAPAPREPGKGQAAVWASSSWHLHDWIDPALALPAPGDEQPAEAG
jgi:hypothetical protein